MSLNDAITIVKKTKNLNAIHLGNAQIVDLLIKNGANIHLLDKNNNTALDHSILKCNLYNFTKNSITSIKKVLIIIRNLIIQATRRLQNY